MPLPTIPDVYRCALTTRYGLTGQYAVNVFHVRSVGGNVAEVMADLVVLVKNANSPYRALMANSALLDNLAITPLFNDAATQVQTLGTDGTGLLTGEGTINSPAIMTIRSARRGPANRGRQYLPFISEGAINAGSLLAANVNTANTNLNTWIGLLAAQNLDIGVASYVNAEFSTHSTIEIEAQLGTQRRRQDRLRTTS